MLRKFLFLFMVSALFLGCKEDNDQSGDDVIVAKGGVRYGGDFRFMSSEKVTSLFPLSVTDVYANRIASQAFEGLLMIDSKSTEVVPSIAKSYEVDEASKVFTFKLREDVYFHDDACFEGGNGRQVKASDFKFSLEFACSKNDLNELSWLLKDKVKGAKAYYNGKADAVEGIKVLDEYTLQIELVTPFSGFQKVLTHTGLSIFPKEAYTKYGEEIGQHPVGTGAFMLKSLEEDKIVLVRNNNYWGKDDFGNELPFLDKIVMTYSEDKTDELLSFRAEEIDLVLDIPVEEVENVLGTLREAQAGENVKHVVDSKSSMSISYYGFAHGSEVFSKKEVRQAFNIAIDREAIIETWLEGEGWAANHGFVPKMKGYPQESVNGYEFDVAKAKSLLAKAGYPNGKRFPTIDLYVNGLEESGIHKLAKAVSFSLKQNLGVNINVKLCSIEEREEAIRSNEAIFWRSGWVADYPDPENFLNLFYGGNMDKNDVNVNPFKYENPAFDALFEKALAETDEEKRMELLADCDQMIIDDAVVMPLLTDDFVTMVNLKVRKFVTNEMEQLDFSRIYIKDVKN
jgi:peptide/nickel transport system substrate-binding protein